MHQNELLAVLNVKTIHDTPRCVFYFFNKYRKPLPQHLDYESATRRKWGAPTLNI